MSEKPKAKAKPRAKAKAKPKQEALPGIVPPKSLTNHTLKDLNKAGREYKSAAQDLRYAQQRNAIKRLSNEAVQEHVLKVEALREAAFKIHVEYLKQFGCDKKYAEAHLKALQDVKS